jgi:EpsI family protein
VSIGANAVRATIIVLLMHYTDLDISAAKDHQFVGWIVHGISLALMFWIGHMLAEHVGHADISNRGSDFGQPESPIRVWWPITAISVLALSAGPVADRFLLNGANTSAELLAGLPTMEDGWNGTQWSVGGAMPSFGNFSTHLTGRYVRSSNYVDVAVFQYNSSRQNADITSSTNLIADPAKWTIGNVSKVVLESRGKILPAIYEVLLSERSRGGDRLVWYWFDVNGQLASNPIDIKIKEIWSRLRGQTSVSSVVIISTPVSDSRDSASRILREFAGSFYESFGLCITGTSSADNCIVGQVLKD